MCDTHKQIRLGLELNGTNFIHFPYLAITLICEGKERFDFNIPTQIRLGLILPLVCAETLIDINRILFSFRVNTRHKIH